MDTDAVCTLLDEIGALLEVKGENPFKVRAYYQAARALRDLGEDINTIVSDGRLKDVKGIGEALTRKIEELVTTGRMEYHESVKSSVPAGIIDILRLPGLSAKRARALYHTLNITSIEELGEAVSRDRLVNLDGFGSDVQEKIRESLASAYQGGNAQRRVGEEDA